MKLSTKGRYAIIALVDLAIAKGDDLTSLAEISARQDISLPYLEQLFVRLRRADLMAEYQARMPALGIRMTAYIANFLIRGYAASGNIEYARALFEALADPPTGVAAPNTHAPHEDTPAGAPPVVADGVVFREVRLRFLRS